MRGFFRDVGGKLRSVALICRSNGCKKVIEVMSEPKSSFMRVVSARSCVGFKSTYMLAYHSAVT